MKGSEVGSEFVSWGPIFYDGVRDGVRAYRKGSEVGSMCIGKGPRWGPSLYHGVRGGVLVWMKGTEVRSELT